MGVMNIDVNSRKEQRNFGIGTAFMLAAIGGLRWWFHDFTAESMPYYLWSLAVPFLLLGLLWPRALQPVFKVWMQFAEALNWVMTRVMLGVIFYVVITPIGFIMRFTSEDLMKRKWDSSAKTYWEDAEVDENSLDRFRHQF